MATEGIQFDEDNLSTASRVRASNYSANAKQSGMAGWLISHGLAKSPAMAQGIMLILVIVFFFLTFLVLK